MHSFEITPLRSLQLGSWFKLICGASYQDLAAVRNLTLAYALAGADCIDVAADPAVIRAAKAGLDKAGPIADEAGRQYVRPWLMVSMSAGADPHFRKAWFDSQQCPSDCWRPCEKVCPADAIDRTGVIRDRCYGCGRCLPICPLGLIAASSHPTPLNHVAQQVLYQADALEIHTHVGQRDAFQALWQTIQPSISHLKLISISCPDGEALIGYLKDLQQIMASTRADPVVTPPYVIWQTDGRPMSGDIGKGTTHAAIRLAQKVLASDLLSGNGLSASGLSTDGLSTDDRVLNASSFVQLAGGTNQYTVEKLRDLKLLNQAGSGRLKSGLSVSGIAYGSFARRLLMPIIEQTLYLEEVTPTLWKAVALAESLVEPLKKQLRNNRYTLQGHDC
ncbi:MAG: 4Fe-4S ferredoxin [Phormidesmis sp. RL_2_1]|nr:4Fe-4S ferredoxin [Phormidesmis sp. RL_2_1]